MEVIRVSCACGHAMKFAADKVGRKAKCPKCTAIIVVRKPDEANGPAASTVQDEGEGAYGIIVDQELLERQRAIEEQDVVRLKEAKKKKAPKILKKFKSLPDAELWEKVQFGLLFLFLGGCIWAFTQVLVGMWVALGSVEFTDYARLVTNEIERDGDRRQERDPPEPRIPADGRFWEFSQFHHLVALAAGRGFVGFAKFCIIVGLILFPIQSILWMVGYILCLPVPNHHGAKGQLILLMVLNVVNFLFFIFFKLLPITGLYRWYLIPYLVPEVMFTEYNMERLYPYFMLWSASPFWESLLSMFLLFVQYLEPVVGAIFIWSCATTLKDIRVGPKADGVAVNGLSQYSIWLLYLMIALCGTTPVLIGVLRVLYILWYAALMMFIARYTLLMWRGRDMIESRLNPGG
jgi:hypothetical protein